ncbi:MAG: DUF4442 domain-containing protein [Oligoflexia bacterium]|nr:DUF4442 domain-containing protein [Oligoflexia bacterium]
MLRSGLKALPRRFRETLRLRVFGLLRVPMILFVSPSVLEASDERIVVKVPLRRRTRNHWGSMYFGALATGADCACGLLTMMLLESNPRSRGRVGLIFKSFQAEFLKRAEGDVHFVCDEGAAIRKLIEEVLESGQRRNLPVRVSALVPSQFAQEPVARFELVLSLKPI